MLFRSVPARRVRVLFINDTSRNGGPGRSLYFILKYLDPSVVHRAVMLPRPGVISGMYEDDHVAEEIFFESRLVENPVEPWSRAMSRDDFGAPLMLKGVRAAGNVARAATGLRDLAKRLKKGEFDLIYCNGTNACFAGGWLAKKSGVPAIWHVRYTSVPKVAERLHTRLASGANVARIICVSGASASLFPGLGRKVKVIHNALDAETFAGKDVTPTLRTELGFGPEHVIFGSHGRVLPRKGYMEMIDAACAFYAQITPEEAAVSRFVIVGDTPEDYTPDHLEECRARVRALGFQDRILFIGFRADVRPYVADFDVCIVPSIYADPLPRAVIESMAWSKPVIAFDVGGVAEMLQDGETGALISGAPADVPAMARAMVAYLRNPELRRVHGVAARARIEQKFDARTQAKAIQAEIVAAARSSMG